MNEETAEEVAESAPVAAAKKSAREALVGWANDQDGWVRALVAAVLAGQSDPGESTIATIYERYMIEKALAEGELEAIEAMAAGEAELAAGAELRLGTLSAVSGVNALAGGQEIDFNAHLTVVFGENGSGKTGYTRILKAIAEVRTMEEILGNVNESGEVPRAARITYSLGEAEQEFSWKGETGVSPFTAISIFDAPAVALHVDDDLSYTYTPSDLALFPLVGHGIERIRELLEQAITERKPKSNPFLVHFANGTAAYTLIETLGPSTDLAALEALALARDGAAPQIEALTAKIEALSGGAIAAQLSAARARRDLAERLAATAAAARDFQFAPYLAAARSRKEARSEYRKLRDELANASGAEGEAADSWQQFILAGEAYRRHLEEAGHEEEDCIYCRQALGDQALALLARYHQFANDAASERLKAAEEQLELLSKDLLGLDIAGTQDSLAAAREGNEGEAALAEAAAFLTELGPALNSIRECAEPTLEGLLERAEAVGAEAAEQKKKAEELIASLTGKEAERAAELRKAESERRELGDRTQLAARLPEIAEHLSQAKWASRAEELAKKFRGLTKSLTTTVKSASEVLLNTDFERLFGEECEALRAPVVGLAFPGRRGEAARRKTVSAEHKPSKVLSEGEQKVIALADFLAEASLRKVPAPVIFDDPVNSLDYRRIGEVSGRIAKLAGERQVIVFTHNIWLAVELLGRFEERKDECAYYRVSGEEEKGWVEKGIHPRWDTVGKTKGKINKALQDAGAADSGEDREAFIERSYSLMRTWSEVVVETELFAGVLGRFAPNVSMGSLDRVRPERLEAAIAAINPLFERACRVMEGHSQPLESLAITPSLKEAEADWAALQKALADYKA